MRSALSSQPSRLFPLFAVLLSLSAVAHARHLPSPPPAQLEFVNATQGYLGVDLRDLDEQTAQRLKMNGTRGVEIVALDHDAPACKAGLRPHDVITAINSEQVTAADQVRRILRDIPAGRHVTITVSRNGKPMDVKLQLADREALRRNAWVGHFHPEMPYGPAMAPGFAGSQGFMGGRAPMRPTLDDGTQHIGVMVLALGQQLADYFGAKDGTGLLVANVEPETPAAQAGLKAGDVILKANGTPVIHPMDLVGAVRGSAGRGLQLTILRDHHEQTLNVSVPTPKTESLLSPEADHRQLMAEADPVLKGLRGGEFGLKQEELDKLQQDLAGSREQLESALAEAQNQMKSVDLSMLQKELEASRAQVDLPAIQRQLEEAKRTMNEQLRKGLESRPAGSYSF